MKTNKQGVRDLGHASTKPKAPDFGPSELAHKLLCEVGDTVKAGAFHREAQITYGDAVEFGPPLAPEVQEFLQLLAEECAETIQRVTKILRFGVRRNPWDGQDNVERLEAEIGDICAALDVLELLGIIDGDRVQVHNDRKLKSFVVEENPTRPRIRHMTDDLRAKINRHLGPASKSFDLSDVKSGAW
jgi:hypothetical protein